MMLSETIDKLAPKVSKTLGKFMYTSQTPSNESKDPMLTTNRAEDADGSYDVA